MMLSKFMKFPAMCVQAASAADYARREHCIGIEFDQYGRNIGLQLLAKKCAVDLLLEREYQHKYDCVWSISVIKHIYGDYDDTSALQMMYETIKPGGSLFLTIPVDRKHRDEYRTVDVYGLQSEQKGK